MNAGPIKCLSSPFTSHSQLLGCSTTRLRDKICTWGKVSFMTLSKKLSLVDEGKQERTNDKSIGNIGPLVTNGS